MLKRLYERMLSHSFGLLQLFCELLHSLSVFLSHLLDLGFMGSVFLLDGSFQQGHLLFTFGSTQQIVVYLLIYFNVGVLPKDLCV